MKSPHAFVVPTELVAAFMAGYLGWVGWISLTVSTLNSRVSVLEDRQGIHAEQARSSFLKRDVWAMPQLVNVPELFPHFKEN